MCICLAATVRIARPFFATQKCDSQALPELSGEYRAPVSNSVTIFGTGREAELAPVTSFRERRRR